MNKKEFVQSYIDRCNTVIADNDSKAADKLQDEIIGVFEHEITDIKNMLDNYSMCHYGESSSAVDYIGDIKLLQKRLENYAIDIQHKKEESDRELELARLKQPTMTQTTNVTVNVTIDQTIEQINQIPAENLSDAEKETLIGNLYDIEKYKKTGNKSKAWDVAKGVLKYLADKGADAAVAALPLIIQGLQAL